MVRNGAGPASSSSMTTKTERTHILESPHGHKCVVLVQDYTGPAALPMPPSTYNPEDSGAAEAAFEAERDAGATALSSVFTLCNSAIGAGVLSLPYAVREAGVLGGLFFCVIIGFCEAFTLYVLSKFAERYDAISYGQLIRKALGKKLAATLSCVLLLYLFGSCIAYMVIIGDTFSALARKYVEHDSIFADRRVLVAILGWLVVFPLCLPKRLGALSSLSAAAVFGFVYTAIVICFRSYQIVSKRESHWEGVQLFVWDVRALFAVPIVTFGYNCHANVVSVFQELSDEPERLIKALPASLKMVGMLGVILSAILVIMVGYLSVGVAGYLAYPYTVAGNVLNAFPNDDILMEIARVVIGCVVVGHFPLTHFPARRTVEDIVTQGLGWSHLPAALSVLFTAAFVAGTMGVSMVVTDLGAVLHLVGGSAASFMIFFLPGLLLVNAAIVKTSNTRLAGLEGGTADASEPLLRQAALQGIKKTGLVYSPRKSWWAGMVLVFLSITILTITILTSFVH